MLSDFSKNISCSVQLEIDLAATSRGLGNYDAEFGHLENAHVLGQESTYWHVKVHVLMACWAVRNKQPKELLGQLFRIVGAGTKTVFGFVPQGNTGGANVSPFKPMPINPKHQAIISNAKGGV